MSLIEHNHPPGITHYSECPACIRVDRGRWQREYELEKQKMRLLEIDLAGAVEARDDALRALKEIAFANTAVSAGGLRQQAHSAYQRLGGQSGV